MAKRIRRHVGATATALLWVVAASSIAAMGPIAYSVVLTQEPVVDGAGRDQSALNRRPPDGSRIVRLDPNGAVTELAAGLASAGDPCVSFDGTRILFAGKETPDSLWAIYEVDPTGENMRRVTELGGDCFEPCYLPRASVTPPTFEERVPWITFVSTLTGSLEEYGREAAASLYAMNLEPIRGRGTVLWRTTYGLGGDGSPTVMRDGRVLYSSRQHHHQALLAITWAGDNVNAFYGTHEGPPIKTMATEMPDGTVVFVESAQP